MKSSYDVKEKKKKRTAQERKHDIPHGVNPAQQVAYINARLDAAQRELDEQRNGYWDALMLTFLWYLHTAPDLRFGPKRLEKAYKALVEDRARQRTDMRARGVDEFGREILDVADPGQHVEDRYYRDQLKACGFDYDEWEKRVFWIDEKKGIVGWREEDE